MSIMYVIFVCIMLPLLIIFLFRRFAPKKKNVPGELFAEALRNENSGYFEIALINYERALDEVQKTRFNSSSLKSQILAKLKVLHMVIEYQNSFHLVRQND